MGRRDGRYNLSDRAERWSAASSHGIMVMVCTWSVDVAHHRKTQQGPRKDAYGVLGVEEYTGHCDSPAHGSDTPGEPKKRPVVLRSALRCPRLSTAAVGLGSRAEGASIVKNKMRRREEGERKFAG